tara:strand:- start:52 stop:297 length:246 start_codon:yes stop_codon:yes gene_type:complete
MTNKKLPLMYRSFLNFYFIYILPTSILTVIIGAFFSVKSLSLEHLQSQGTWLGFLTFQIVFGTLMLYWDYKPRTTKFKKNA